MWDNLLTALVSGSLVIAGVVFTQRRADQREDRRWDREREHEQAVWDRDDAARSYEHRRDAYFAFLNDYLDMMDRILRTEEEEGPSASFDDDALEPLQRRLDEVQVFGTRAAFDSAMEALVRLSNRCFGNVQPSLQEVMAAKDAFVDQVRRDLHVSDE
jgi:hypothetical protein